MNTPYKPISCDFYDELEALSTHREICTIVVQTANDSVESLSGQITNLYAQSGEEFLVLNNHTHIRLDCLRKVNGKSVPDVC